MFYVALVGILALFLASIADAKFRIIPDTCVAVVAISGLGLRLSEGVIPLSISLAVALGLFAALTLLFYYGAVGGGDVKLLTAASLLFPARAVPAQLVLIAWAGGLLALVWMVGARLFGKQAVTEHEQVQSRSEGGSHNGSDLSDADGGLGYQGHGLPYGIAIFAGTLAGQFFLI